jgi:hypothetical protein
VDENLSAAPGKSLHRNTSLLLCARISFQDFRQSLEGQIRVDCRLNCYACGILPTFIDMRRDHPGEGWKCPDVSPRVLAELPVVGVNTLSMRKQHF